MKGLLIVCLWVGVLSLTWGVASEGCQRRGGQRGNLFTRNLDILDELSGEQEREKGGDSPCTTQSCCQQKCGQAGYCCNYNVHTSSNQYLSCYQGCSMRVKGESKSYVENQCGIRSCSYNDPNFGEMNKCDSCSDSTGIGNCVYGITDSGACMYGSSLADNQQPDNSKPTLEHPNSWYWQMGLSNAQATGGFSFYTGIWEMQAEGYPLANLQFGMAGTWFTPAGFTWNVCGCNPNPTSGVGFGANCCSYDCTTLYETMEGGPGYWIGALPSNAARWRPWGYMGCYNYQFGAPLFWYGRGGSPARCDVLGFVQVSNQLLFPPDGLTISETGLLGVSWINSGMGKTNSSDTRNSWTLVIDSTNFQGPLGYVLPDVWTERDYGWEQQSASLPDFSNCPDSAQNGMAFEWNTYYSYHTDSTWKIPQQMIPVVDGAGALASSSFGYDKSDTATPIEQVLNTGKSNDNNIMNHPQSEKCHPKKENGVIMVNKTVSVTIGTLETVSEGDDCIWQLTPRNSSCESWSGDCELPAYFSTGSGNPIEKSQAPPQLQSAQFPKDSGTAAYDAYHHTASGGCQTSPGPAKKTIYCTKTSAQTWVAYQWYKFVDQPPLQRAHLTNDQKNYMQNRIENLHKSIKNNHGKAEWLKPSSAVKSRKRASMDTATLIKPPSGLEIGYVPIAIYESNGSSKPSFCDVSV